MLIHHSALVKPGVSNQRIPGKWGRESAIGTPDLGRGRLYVHPVEEQWMKNSVYRTDESKSREILGYTQPGDLLASAYLYNFKLLTVKLFVYCDRSSFMGLSKWRQPTDLFKSTTDPPKSQERDRAGKEFWMEPRKNFFWFLCAKSEYDLQLSPNRYVVSRDTFVWVGIRPSQSADKQTQIQIPMAIQTQI